MQFLIVVLRVYLKIILIVLFYATEFLIILHWLWNYFKKLYKALKLVCVLVNNNLCGKLFSSLESPTIFNDIFKVFSVLFFIPDFN